MTIVRAPGARGCAPEDRGIPSTRDARRKSGAAAVSAASPLDFDTALRLIEASDERWRRTEGGDAEVKLNRPSLERYAHALAFVAHETPRWVETVSYSGPSDTVESEVRVLGADALYVITTPWVTDDEHGPEPTVRVRPLSALRALEVDGFETDAAGRPVGCTVTLVFSGGSAVRLGASNGADRTGLVPLLPELLRRVGA